MTRIGATIIKHSMCTSTIGRKNAGQSKYPLVHRSAYRPQGSGARPRKTIQPSSSHTARRHVGDAVVGLTGKICHIESELGKRAMLDCATRASRGPCVERARMRRHYSSAIWFLAETRKVYSREDKETCIAQRQGLYRGRFPSGVAQNPRTKH